MNKKFIFTVLLCLLFTSFIVKADFVTPDYELKFYLKNDKVLKANSEELNDNIKEYFFVSHKIKMIMEFLDTSSLKIYNDRWIVRVRNREDKKKLELTYKFRIPVQEKIIDALIEAEKLGWDSSQDDYDYQIDWGYSKKTLSISKKKKKIDVSGVDEENMKLPDLKQAKKIAIKKMPKKLEKWNKKDWAEDALKASKLYGPVKGTRHVGSWGVTSNGVEICIEVWKIANTIITELSFKTETYEEALSLHDAMQRLLEYKGWLLNKDILKTRMILNSY